MTTPSPASIRRWRYTVIVVNRLAIAYLLYCVGAAIFQAFGEVVGNADYMVVALGPSLLRSLPSVFMLLPLAAALWWGEKRIVRFLAPQPPRGCPNCGYPVENLRTPICPECGASLA